MEVILLQDVDKLGDRYDVVKVKPGYGRNFLIPRKLAVVANDANKKVNIERLRQMEDKDNRRLDEFRVVAKQLDDIKVKIGAKTGTSGKIFGSISNVQLSNALRDQHNIAIERKKIHIVDEVKEVGEYVADVQLHKEVLAKLKFEVVAE